MLFHMDLLFSEPQQFFLILLYTLLAIFIAMTVHEWGHAFVAWKLGDPTAKNLGRMSLDPMKHMDPIGLACFVLLGFGWAKPVIVNPNNLKNYRRDDILISMAGPLMNLITAFVFTGIWYLCVVFFFNNIALQVINYILWYNIVLALFNIIPVYPLDGYHVLSSVLTGRLYPVLQFVQKYGYLILIALIASRLIDRYLDVVGGWIMSLFMNFFGLFL